LRVIRCPTLQVSQFLFPGQRSDTFLTDLVYWCTLFNAIRCELVFVLEGRNLCLRAVFVRWSMVWSYWYR